MKHSWISTAVALAFASVTVAGAAIADAVSADVTRVTNAFMITPDMAFAWNYYNAQGGST